jgi:hypothetical protein
VADYPDAPVGEVDPHDHSVTHELGLESYLDRDFDDILDETGVEPPAETLDTEWVPREELLPNDWNPNFMPEHRRDLLVLSILDNGWTQPIVARTEDNVIIDGEHRWRVAQDERVSTNDDLTPEGVPSGHVPVHFIDAERKQSMVATYQQNYATGSDDADKLGDLVADLDEADRDYAATRMGVSTDELEMLLPDESLVDDPTELWETPWDEDLSVGAFTERVSYEMLAEEAALLEHIFGDAGTANGLVKLCRFIVETDLYEDVDDVPEPDWSVIE